jgi:hypothetical protein
MSAQELHGRERCVVHGRSATLDWARDRSAFSSCTGPCRNPNAERHSTYTTPASVSSYG